MKRMSVCYRQQRKGAILVDNFNRRVVRDTTQEFYPQRKVIPTVCKLSPSLKKKID